MKINKNDFTYLLIGIVFAGLIAVVVANPDLKVRLFSVAALLAVGLVIAIYINPNLGATVLVVTVFTNISALFTENGLPSINQPLVAVVGAAILMGYNSARPPAGRTKTSGIERYLALYFLITALSYFVADDKDRAIDVILGLGKDIAIIYCFLFALRRPDTWISSAWIIIVVTAVLCLLGGYQVITGNYGQVFFGLAGVVADISEYSTTYRIAGPILEPNIWGEIVVAVVPLVIYRIIYERRMSTKFFSIAILGILLYEILNTYSRGAYVALAVIVFLVLLGQRLRPLTWFAIIASMVFVFPLLPSSYTGRFQTLLLLSSSAQNGTNKDESFQGRTSKMLTGLLMFSSNPLLGVGAGNYPNNFEKYSITLGLEKEKKEAGEEIFPHSLYIQILSETGIMAIIAFLGLAILILVNLFRARKSIEYLEKYKNWIPWLSAIQLSVLGYLITSFFLHGGYIRYFWIFVAMALSAIQLTEELRIGQNTSYSMDPLIYD